MSGNPNVNPPPSTNPQLTLDGINGLAQYNRRTIPTLPYNLNGMEQYFNYNQLMGFLSTPIALPSMDTTKLEIVPNPPVNIPDYQKAIFPTCPCPRLPVQGKVALVIGGSRNLGKIISLYLQSVGYKTIATSRDPSAYFGVNRNPLLSDVGLDVRVQSSVDNFFNRVIKPLGRLDVLINCQGLHTAGPVQGYDAQFFNNVFEVKQFGTNRCITAALPYLRKNPNSRVLCFSSIAGCEMYTNPFLGMYSISNHALDAMVKQYNLDEMMQESMGYITNKITYVTIEPVLILSTIGLYNVFQTIPSYEMEILSKPPHMAIGALQSDVGGPFGFPATGTSMIGKQIYDIISAPQPVFKYFLGDPDSKFGGVPIPDSIAQSNMLSDVDLFNQTIVPIGGLYNDFVINLWREGLKSIYVPPS